MGTISPGLKIHVYVKHWMQTHTLHWIYWFTDYANMATQGFGWRIATKTAKSQWATTKLRIMLAAQNWVPLHCREEIKALASGLRPTVAASVFLV